MKIKSGWHQGGYRDLATDAGRELIRAFAAPTEEDLRSAVDSFCLKFGRIPEFVFVNHVRGDSLWSAQQTLYDFEQWLKGRCREIAQLNTAYIMAKHPVVDLKKHDRQIDGLDYSLGATTSGWKVPGTLIVRRQTVETPAGQETTTEYVSPNIKFDGQKMRLSEVADAAITFWSCFEPKKGPSQNPLNR